MANGAAIVYFNQDQKVTFLIEWVSANIWQLPARMQMKSNYIGPVFFFFKNDFLCVAIGSFQEVIASGTAGVEAPE